MVSTPCWPYGLRTWPQHLHTQASSPWNDCIWIIRIEKPQSILKKGPQQIQEALENLFPGRDNSIESQLHPGLISTPQIPICLQQGSIQAYSQLLQSSRPDSGPSS